MATFEEFYDLYRRAQFLDPRELRKFGAELELLLVQKDGSIGDALRVIWDLARQNGWRPEYDKHQPGLLIGAKHHEYGLMTVDAGCGTLEWVTPVYYHLMELHYQTMMVMNQLVLVASMSGQYIIGTGMQPLTRAHPKHLIPKDRYGLFLERFGGHAFGGFSTNAALQVSVDARSGDDMAELTIDMMALSGAIIALTANSSVVGGKPGTKLAHRFDVWDNYAAPTRIGVLEKPPGDLEEYCRHLWGLEYVFGPDGAGGHRLYGETFGECAATFNGDLRTHAAYHEGCVWLDARPRFVGEKCGYVEVRQPCEQPQGEATMVAALIVGLAENTQGRRELHNLGTWKEWRDSRLTAAQDAEMGSFGEKRIIADILPHVLDVAEAGLKRRNMGEEKLLRPLRTRLHTCTPALAQLEAFRVGGVPELIERFRFREKPVPTRP